MELQTITIDTELAITAHCRVGTSEVLIMPWYASTLHQHPSNCLDWIVFEGQRLLGGLQFLHSFEGGGYAHFSSTARLIIRSWAEMVGGDLR